MSIILDKFRKLGDFKKYSFKVDNEEILISLKRLTQEQNNFLSSNIDLILKNENVIEFFCEILENTKEEITKILNNEDAAKKLIQIVFSSNSLNYNFDTLLSKELKKFTEEKDTIVTFINATLLKFGYKFLELKKLTERELLEVFVFEYFFKKPEEFVNFVKENVNLETNDLLSIISSLEQEIEDARRSVGASANNTQNKPIDPYEALKAMG